MQGPVWCMRGRRLAPVMMAILLLGAAGRYSQVQAAEPSTELKRLQAKYGRAVDLSVSVDPELIGGVLIRIGDEVIDASVRGKLAQLATALKN